MLRLVSSPSCRCIPRRLLKTSILKNASTVRTARRGLATTGTDNFLSTSNATYIDEMYQAWQKDPSSVHVSWDAYFKNMSNPKIPATSAFQAPPSITNFTQGTEAAPLGTAMSGSVDQNVSIHLKVQLLCRAYQVRGHLKAHIDPLGISFGSNKSNPVPPELTLDYYGFTKQDLDKEINLGRYLTKICHRW